MNTNLVRLVHFCLLLILVSDVSGQVRNYTQFKSLLGQATTRVNKTLNLEHSRGKLAGILSRNELEGRSDGGAWQFGLSGWYNEKDAETISVLQGPAIVVNNGSSMSYAFLTQIVPETLADRIWDSRDVKKVAEETVKEYGDVQVQFGRQDGRFVVGAEIPYANLRDGGIEDRIVHLMMQSRHLLMATEKGIRDSAGDLKDELEDGRPTRLGASEFEILIGRGLDKLRADNAEATDGFWSVRRNDTNFRIYNFGDRLVFAPWDWHYNDVLPAQRGWLKTEMDEWLSSKRLEGATLSTRFDPGEYTRFEILATITLDGSLTGKQIRNLYNKVLDDLGPDAVKRADRIQKSTGERTAEAETLLLSEPLTYVSAANFNRLLSGFEDYHADFDGFREGWYEFKIQDRNFEFYLDGERLEYTLWTEFPGADEAKRAAWIESVREWLTQNPPPGSASTEVVWYEENPVVMWAKAHYHLDGSMTGEQFKQTTISFMRDYSVQLSQFWATTKSE